MQYLGAIRAAADPPGINQERWIELIRTHPALVHPEPIAGINPITRKPTFYKAPGGFARVVLEGVEVGTLSWSQNDASEIDVFGDQRVLTMAHIVAHLLSARFVPHEKS